MDYETALRYSEILENNPKYEELILEDMIKNYVDTRCWTNYKVDELGNIITFSSGFGDGSYPSYWGYDEKDEICCLVTDFVGLFDD